MTAVRRRQLTRVGVWIALATVAVLTVVLTARTETGIRRVAALIAPADPVRMAKAPVPNRQSDQEAEQRRLSETVRALAADRDRLLARLNALERNLEDVTGSIPPKTAAPSTPVLAAPLPAPQAATPLTQAAPSNQARIAAGCARGRCHWRSKPDGTAFDRSDSSSGTTRRASCVGSCNSERTMACRRRRRRRRWDPHHGRQFGFSGSR